MGSGLTSATRFRSNPSYQAFYFCAHRKRHQAMDWGNVCWKRHPLFERAFVARAGVTTGILVSVGSQWLLMKHAESGHLVAAS